MDETKHKLLAFVRDHLVSDPASVKGTDQPLISSGLMDSFSLVDLQAFIEDEWDIQVPNSHMTVANFDTIERAAVTVARFAEE